MSTLLSVVSVPVEVNYLSSYLFGFCCVHMSSWQETEKSTRYQKACLPDFYNYVQLAVQTAGYDTWSGGESNLLITRSLIGRLTNASYANFQLHASHVIDYLASRGIQAFPGNAYSAAESQGRLWQLRPSQHRPATMPTQLLSRTRSTGAISLRFRQYTDIPYRLPPNIAETATEEIADTEFVGVALAYNPFADCPLTDEEFEDQFQTAEGHSDTLRPSHSHDRQNSPNWA